MKPVKKPPQAITQYDENGNEVSSEIPNISANTLETLNRLRNDSPFYGGENRDEFSHAFSLPAIANGGSYYFAIDTSVLSTNKKLVLKFIEVVADVSLEVVGYDSAVYTGGTGYYARKLYLDDTTHPESLIVRNVSVSSLAGLFYDGFVLGGMAGGGGGGGVFRAYGGGKRILEGYVISPGKKILFGLLNNSGYTLNSGSVDVRFREVIM